MKWTSRQVTQPEPESLESISSCPHPSVRSDYTKVGGKIWNGFHFLFCKKR